MLAAAARLATSQTNLNQVTDPSIHKPVTVEEMERLSRVISDETRSSVELIGEYHTETGDLNNRLDFYRAGARLNYRWQPGLNFYLSGVRTQYMTLGDVLDGNGTNVTAGARIALADGVNGQFEIGATRFNTSTSTINALASLNFKASDAATFYLTGSRSNVEESLLSAIGLRPVNGPFAGRLVGRVMDNRVVGGLQYRLPLNFDVSAEGGGGVREGLNVDDNFFRLARAGLGYNPVSQPQDETLSLFRVGYFFEYLGYDEDRLGFGGASLLTRRGQRILPSQLGIDGISPEPGPGRPGVGGYFSPQRYTSHAGRAELEGRPLSVLRYRLAGFAGAQSYTGSPTREVYGVSATAELVFTDRFSLPVTFARDNYGPFTQQTLWARLVVKL